MTRTLRLAVIQYGDDPTNPDTAIFAAGWDVDPDDRHFQDDSRIRAAKKVCGYDDKFIRSIRFIEVPVELTETEMGTVQLTSVEKPC